MKEISLTQGQVAIVDDDRYDELSKLTWQASWSPSTKSFYACSGVYRKGPINMARMILNAPKGVFVDHINGDTLDNRVDNLRLATNRQNQQNQHKQKSSIYPGVYWKKANSKWVAKISINKKDVHLGYFFTERDAFNAYISACQTHGFDVDQMLEKFESIEEDENRKLIYPCSRFRKCSNQRSDNKSGVTGVHWKTRDNRWVAQIGVNGKRFLLGSFRDISDAITTRKSAEVQYFSTSKEEPN
ncbi:MAG: HNH endonuclease [Desulfitobacterium hafniense]|nr:HNH endonuclease [Desulfitobacterium hafniense]